MTITKSLKDLAAGCVRSAFELLFKSNFVIIVHLLYSSSVLNDTSLY